MWQFMKRTAILGAALASAAFVGTYIYAADNTGATGQPANPGMGQAPANAAQNETVDATTAKDVHSRIASIINSGVTRDKFNDLVGSFDKPTRDRIDQEGYKDFDKLNASIDQFRKDFRDKYNQDFDLKTDALSAISVYRGTNKDEAFILLSAFRGANALDPANAANPANQPLNAAANAEAQINFVHEKMLGNAWRLQPPASLTARGLTISLTDELTKLSSNKDKWPADVNEAYLHVTGRILRTIENPQETNVTVENR